MSTDNQQAIIQELQERLSKAHADWDLEHELHMGTERDLQKQIKELQEENVDLKKRIKELVHECIRLTARAEAAKSIAAVWEKAAEGVINGLVGEEDDAKE